MTDQEYQEFRERCLRALREIREILHREGFTIEDDMLIDVRGRIGNTGYSIPENLSHWQGKGKPV